MPNRKPNHQQRRAESRKKAESIAEQSHSDPHQKNTEENERGRLTDKSIRVVNEVHLQIPPDFLAEYKASQKDNAAHNNKTRLIGWLTLFAVTLYTTVAAIQSCAVAKQADAAKEANRLLEESTRARLSLNVKLVEMPVAGDHIKIDIQASNVGHALAIVGDSTSNWIGTTLPDGDMQVPEPVLSNLTEPGTPPLEILITGLDFVSQDFLQGLPTLDENLVEHRTQYFFGKVNYETLGRIHKMTFCFYLIRANDYSRLTGGQLGGQPFSLHNCPKWNSSE